MKYTKGRFHAWAIHTNTGGHSFIGRYWWFNTTSPKIPPHMEGCHIALFKTRAIAREHLPSVRRYSFPKAKVVRVIMTVEVE
jgi:hypothetical protein